MEKINNTIINILSYRIFGETIIKNTLRSASYFLSENTSSIKKYKQGSCCLTFIEQGGIETLINRFDLPLSEERLVTLFFIKQEKK